MGSSACLRRDTQGLINLRSDVIWVAFVLQHVFRVVLRCLGVRGFLWFLVSGATNFLKTWHLRLHKDANRSVCWVYLFAVTCLGDSWFPCSRGHVFMAWHPKIYVFLGLCVCCCCCRRCCCCPLLAVVNLGGSLFPKPPGTNCCEPVASEGSKIVVVFFVALRCFWASRSYFFGEPGASECKKNMQNAGVLLFLLFLHSRVPGPASSTWCLKAANSQTQKNMQKCKKEATMSTNKLLDAQFKHNKNKFDAAIHAI